MPTRILLRLFLLAGLAAPLCAFALGVGQLEVRSSLNQIFEAEIPLIITNPAELTGLAVRLPRQQDFDRAGVERLELLSKLRFAVRTPPGGPNSSR
jgi:pilus assembly protein FimV